MTGWDIFYLGPFLLSKLENLKILKPLMQFFAWLWIEENVKDLGRHWEVLKDIPGLQLTLWSNPFVSTSTSPSLGDLNLRHFETWKVKVIGVCLPYFCHTFPEIFLNLNVFFVVKFEFMIFMAQMRTHVFLILFPLLSDIGELWFSSWFEHIMKFGVKIHPAK